MHAPHDFELQYPATVQLPLVKAFDEGTWYGAEALDRIQHCPLALPTASQENAEQFAVAAHSMQHEVGLDAFLSPRLSGPTMSMPCSHVTPVNMSPAVAPPSPTLLLDARSSSSPTSGLMAASIFTRPGQPPPLSRLGSHRRQLLRTRRR